MIRRFLAGSVPRPHLRCLFSSGAGGSRPGASKKEHNMKEKFPEFPSSMHISEYVGKYAHLNSEVQVDVSTSLIGRLMKKQSLSPKLFLHYLSDVDDVHGSDGQVQVMAKTSGLGLDKDELSKLHEDAKHGDIVGVTGFPGKTKAGVLTLFARSYICLSRKGLNVSSKETQMDVAAHSNFLAKDWFSTIASKVAPSVVQLYVPEGGTTGSGFIADADGLIITCAHVAVDRSKIKFNSYKYSEKKVRVTLSDGKKVTGIVIDYDFEFDLALVKIEPPSISPVKFGLATGMRIGDLVCCIGSTLGYPNSFSKGVISSLERTSKQVIIGSPGKLYFQTDCSSAEGNSGCPLVNLDGEVIGLCVGGVPVGIQFSLRIDIARKCRIFKRKGYENLFECV